MFDPDKLTIVNRTLGIFDARKEIDWLLKFAGTDLTTISDPEREAVRYCLFAMLTRGQFPLGKAGRPDVSTTAVWTDFGEDAPLPTWDQVLRTQESVRRTLSEFLGSKSTKLSLDPITLEITTAYGRRKQNALLIMDSESPETAFDLRLAAILQAHGGYITTCDKCGTIFLARRSDQVFCSQPCQNREMQRRFRIEEAKRKKEAERRRKEEIGPRKRRRNTAKRTRTKGGKDGKSRGKG